MVVYGMVVFHDAKKQQFWCYVKDTHVLCSRDMDFS